MTWPIDIYADTSDLQWIRANAGNPLIRGFTTNPSLMRKAGVTNYEQFGPDVLEAAQGKPVSLEVVSDDPDEMVRQAKKIAAWGDNAWVKIPCIHANGQVPTTVIQRLVEDNIKLNITALISAKKFVGVLPLLHYANQPILSVFAGRLTDCFQSASNVVVALKKCYPNYCVLWASCRSVYNVQEAVEAGADIITLFPSMIDKLSLRGKNLDDYTIETVKGFLADAQQAGYAL